MPNVNPVKYTTAFTMRADQEFLDAVEELRRLQTLAAVKADAEHLPTKSDVIREAVMEALKRARAKGKR
jgi:ABC-type transport system involved in cytochrome bd biosynthesis fused ATPase/permease subunit